MPPNKNLVSVLTQLNLIGRVKEYLNKCNRNIIHETNPAILINIAKFLKPYEMFVLAAVIGLKNINLYCLNLIFQTITIKVKVRPFLFYDSDDENDATFKIIPLKLLEINEEKNILIFEQAFPYELYLYIIHPLDIGGVYPYKDLYFKPKFGVITWTNEIAEKNDDIFKNDLYKFISVEYGFNYDCHDVTVFDSGLYPFDVYRPYTETIQIVFNK